MDQIPGMFDPTTMMRLWGAMAAQMSQAGATAAPPWTPEAAREARSSMLDVWAQAWDRFLRSPEFLDIMKQTLAASVEWRKQLNEFLGNLHHQFQGVSRQDIDEVMLSIRHLEERTVDTLETAVEDLTAKIDEIASRLPRTAAEEEAKPGVGGNGSHSTPGREEDHS